MVAGSDSAHLEAGGGFFVQFSGDLLIVLAHSVLEKNFSCNMDFQDFCLCDMVFLDSAFVFLLLVNSSYGRRNGVNWSYGQHYGTSI